MADEGKKYILLNTTEKEYEEWLSGKIREEMAKLEEKGCKIL